MLLETDLYFKQGCTEKFSFLEEGESLFKPDFKPYKDKSVLVVGAGALGNIMTLALAKMGIGAVDYLDPDVVESHNLSRQVLFHDAVGKSKAEVLARKHSVIDPKAKVRSFSEYFMIENGKYTAERMRDRYDLVLDLVDNLYARAMLSAYAVQTETPLVSAASSPTAAQIATYVPGVTACLNHVFAGYYEKGVQEELTRRNSCIAEPDPSVIITNQVGAALAALEACTIFDSRYGGPFSGSLKYTTDMCVRFGENRIGRICDCHKNKEDIPDMEI